MTMRTRFEEWFAGELSLARALRHIRQSSRPFDPEQERIARQDAYAIIQAKLGEIQKLRADAMEETT